MAEIAYTGMSLGNLEKLDERIGIKFRQLVADAAADCLDRPNEKGKRTITVEIEVVPVLEADGTLDRVDTKVQLKLRRPIFRSKTYGLLATKAGLKWNSGDPEHPRQQTLAMGEDPEESDDDGDEFDEG